MIIAVKNVHNLERKNKINCVILDSGGCKMYKKVAALLIILPLILSACAKKSSSQNKNQNYDAKKLVEYKDGNKTEQTSNESTQTPDKTVSTNPVPKTETTTPPDVSNLSNKLNGWYYKAGQNHNPPTVPQNINNLLAKYSGYYLGDTTQKVIYITFDEGYENGYTPKILDILKANNVKAAFFVTKHYITSSPDLVKRMVDEGHTVCNHSSKHLSMPSITGNANGFNNEFTDTEKAFKEITGQDMPKLFRPPMGEYSEKSLYMTQKLGYKSIFWSFAHKDWLVNDQPPVNVTHDKIINSSHNGEIMLLHAVSSSDTNALDSVIKDLKSMGYRFGTLDELK